ncbi:jerky protein homolog-like [Schistocerca nitens]|uniref:jerky protein homolog-like n=1 Tax=Schistocerca nitens TaxID=7011 RepID=UPI0021184663|nr:jerky protein homolog-like [Schistocerca nitens]XP_049807804.1 jerky protein homolog-like [Schistocerca nitens]
MKHRYRKIFIERLLSSDESTSVKQFWRSYSIKDAIFNVASAWSDLSVSNLKNGWNKLWPQPRGEELEEPECVTVDEMVNLCNNLQISTNLTPEEVSVWLQCDKVDGGFQILSDDEIFARISATKEEEEEEGADEDECSNHEEKQTISHSEAETMLSKCIEWFESQEETNATQALLLRKIRNIAAVKAETSKRQKKLTDYFQAR